MSFDSSDAEFHKTFHEYKSIPYLFLRLIEATVTSQRLRALAEVKNPFETETADFRGHLQNAVKEANETRYFLVEFN